MADANMTVCPHCGGNLVAGITINPYGHHMNKYTKDGGKTSVVINSLADTLNIKDVIYTRIDNKTGLPVEVKKEVKAESHPTVPVPGTNAPSGAVPNQKK